MSAIPTASSGTARPLILIIDDDLAEMLGQLLEDDFRVLTYKNGDDILTLPRETLMEAACALVDDSLPGNLSGVQTMAALHLINPAIKVYPMPGCGFTEYEQALIAPHYCQIFAKPFDAFELIQILKAATTCATA